jgi:hypothetical protein
MTLLNIVPECYGDTRLVEILLEAEKVNHQKNIGQVANTLLGKLKDQPALAIVDDDKKSIPTYFKTEFEPVKEGFGLKLLRHKTKNHFLIRIHPALEIWLWKAATEAGVSMDAFKVGRDVNGLKKTTKDMTLQRNMEFTQFVKTLRRKESQPILLLKKWMEDFLNKKLG